MFLCVSIGCKSDAPRDTVPCRDLGDVTLELLSFKIGENNVLSAFTGDDIFVGLAVTGENSFLFSFSGDCFGDNKLYRLSSTGENVLFLCGDLGFFGEENSRIGLL